MTYPNTDVAEYTYDANGNRLTAALNSTPVATYTYDDADQLVSDGTNSYTYDDAGNMTAAGSDSFSWDWANRLTSATVNSVVTTFSYDGDNLRTSRTANSVTSDYVWDRVDDLPLVVDDGNHAYLHADGLVGEVDDSDDALYHLTDALGSVRGLTDEAGAVVGTTNYAVFGEVNGTNGTSSAYGYTGELSDPTTGLTYLRARYTNPSLGRFLSMDTVQPNAPGTQGYNRCAYVANNPATWTDPTGHTCAAFAGEVYSFILGSIWAAAFGTLLITRADGRGALFIKFFAGVGSYAGQTIAGRALEWLHESTGDPMWLRSAEAVAGVPMIVGGLAMALTYFQLGEPTTFGPAGLSILVAGVLLLLAATYIKALTGWLGLANSLASTSCRALAGLSDFVASSSNGLNANIRTQAESANSTLNPTRPVLPSIKRPEVLGRH